MNKRYSATEISEVIEEIDILIRRKCCIRTFREEDNIQKLHKDQVIKPCATLPTIAILCKYSFFGDFSGQANDAFEVGKRAIDFLIDNSGLEEISK